MSAIDDSSPLRGEDVARLAEYFSSDKISFFGMYLDEVDGLFAAIACVPDEVTPPEWLPLVFGRDDPVFDSVDESEAIIGGLMRLFNHVNRLINDSDDYTPVLSGVKNESGHEDIHVERWAGGFIEGMKLREELWFEDEADELAVLVSTLFVLAKIDPPELQVAPQMTGGPGPIHEKIPQLVYMMRDYWLYIGGAVWDEMEAGPEWLDLEEPCPCGSGKDYGRCCGRVSPALN